MPFIGSESGTTDKKAASTMTVHRQLKPLSIVVLFLISVASAWAGNPLINKGADNVAIKGYDPVAYFVDARATPGKPEYRHNWRGATWYFGSEENRQRFVREPERYAPQYGGYCAYAASFGQLANIDPQSWSIVNGKLYLNFSSRVQQIWKPRSNEFIGDADQLWPGVVKQHSR